MRAEKEGGGAATGDPLPDDSAALCTSSPSPPSLPLPGVFASRSRKPRKDRVGAHGRGRPLTNKETATLENNAKITNASAKVREYGHWLSPTSPLGISAASRSSSTAPTSL